MLRAREPLLLEEVVSAAVVAAANLTLPPKTIGLHIVDREGRKVFVRERTNLKAESPSRSGPETRPSGLGRWALSQWRGAVKTKHPSNTPNKEVLFDLYGFGDQWMGGDR
jgi:hypothetical protein